MRHEVTIISDDLRVEAGKKLTLVGIYDQAIIFQQLPSRLLKLAFFQRWLETSGIEKVFVEIRGEPLGDNSVRIEGGPTERETDRAEPLPLVRIALIFGPVDFLRTGNIEFRTYFNDKSQPSHVHQLEIRSDASVKPFEF
jgi:hypothetical protein